MQTRKHDAALELANRTMALAIGRGMANFRFVLKNTLPCCFSINMESVVFFYFFKVVVKLKIFKNLKFDSLGKKNGKILNFEEKLLKNL